MPLQYVRHLTSSERPFLTRIVKGRCGRQRPTGWKRERARLQGDEGSEGEGGLAGRNDRGCPDGCFDGVPCFVGNANTANGYTPLDKPCRRSGRGDLVALGLGRISFAATSKNPANNWL